MEKSNNLQKEENTAKIKTQKTFEAITKRINSTENCFICDSTQVLKTLDDVFKMDRFKNKVVYLDFWGTGCKPCFQEFAYTPDLKKQFQNQPIEYLYISTFSSKGLSTYNKMLWEMLIEKHKLEGIVLHVSRDFKNRFIHKYKDQTDPLKLYAVPKYILFDKKGEIVDFSAPRPSSKEELYERIQLLLNE